MEVRCTCARRVTKCRVILPRKYRTHVNEIKIFKPNKFQNWYRYVCTSGCECSKLKPTIAQNYGFWNQIYEMNSEVNRDSSQKKKMRKRRHVKQIRDKYLTGLIFRNIKPVGFNTDSTCWWNARFPKLLKYESTNWQSDSNINLVLDTRLDLTLR